MRRLREQRKPIRRNSKNDFACTPARYPVAATHSSITGIVAAASTPSTIFKASSSSVSESLAETSNVLSASTSGSMVSEPSDSIAVQLRSDTPPPPPPAGWLECERLRFSLHFHYLALDYGCLPAVCTFFLSSFSSGDLSRLYKIAFLSSFLFNLITALCFSSGWNDSL
ncbi:hypothetical protein BC829DRAFT_382335 [Chytridium lagenaria]|nr:hypothetical protein BC829DRAFT_382335 [Chytridium lagenaria]